MKTEIGLSIMFAVAILVWWIWDYFDTVAFFKIFERPRMPRPIKNMIPDWPYPTPPPPRSRPLHEYSALNLNSIILVKLTDLGYKHLVSLHNANLNVIPEVMVRDPDYYRQRADDDGYTRFLVWEFIKKFGDVTGIACLDYYDTKIRIMNNDLTPVVP